MATPLTALAWEIWAQKRRWAAVIFGLMALGVMLNVAWFQHLPATSPARDLQATINGFLTIITLVLVFGIFNYTEYNPHRDWTGFPYRNFALPVTSLTLVGVPLLLGIAAVETAYFLWMRIAFWSMEGDLKIWLGVLLAVYMILFQMVLWVLAGFRSLRILLLSFIGTSFVGVAFLPSMAQYNPSAWFSIPILSSLATAVGLAAFAGAWLGVARQRSGGGARRRILQALLDGLADLLPRRRTEFSSAAAAQFWMEWRRGGWLLPGCAGAILVTVIAPLSWAWRQEAQDTAWILGWTLALPILIAWPVGKLLSTPAVWSRTLDLPTWLAVRPLATGDFVVTKMKVAAWSAAATWLLVLVFLSVWLPSWANLDGLSMVRVGFWMVSSHTVLPQYGMAAAGLLTAFLLTWRLLVSGLWIGLAGSRKLQVGSAALFVATVLIAMIGLSILLEHDQAVRRWGRQNPDQLLAGLEWILAAAIIVRWWLAARTWRSISSARARTFLGLWLGGSATLLAGAALLWAHGGFGLLLISAFDLVPVDLVRLRNTLFLAVLLVIPLVRLGLAPGALARNRHEIGARQK